MKIIIVGANEIGSVLAEYLVADHNNNITIIDENPDRLFLLQERYDLQTICNKGSYPNVLKIASASEADILLAVTDSDEINLVTCQIAHSLFKIPNCVARIQADEYVNNDFSASLFNENNFPIERIITPENLITEYIYNLVEFPGAFFVGDFADKKVYVVGIKAYYGGRLVGDELSEINFHLPNINTKIVGIYRNDHLIQARENTILDANDEVYFIAQKEDISSIISEFQKNPKNYKKIIINGGNAIGRKLAAALEKDHSVKLIEQNEKRAIQVSEVLQNTLVLNGDPADQDLLLQEHIEKTDLFLAITNDDESNIMSSMLAKKLGARKTIALVRRNAYLNLMQDDMIDIIISPQQITISALLNFIRKDNIERVVSIHNKATEIIQIIVKPNSKVIGKYLYDISFPQGTMITTIIRDGIVMMATTNFTLQEEDTAIIFVTDKKYIKEIESFFSSK